MNKIYTAFPESPGGSIAIGTYTVHYYALLILAGIILAVWITGSRLKSRGAEGALSLDVALFAVPFGIVGGRAYHVITHWNDYFGAGKDPMSALYVWEGGLAIYGALIFGIVGAIIGARFSGLRFFSYVDALVPGLLLAQAIGRWGNYFNAELFGAPTTLPWGVPISAPNPALPIDLPLGTLEDPTLFTPTFLYESVWCLIGIVVLLYIERLTQPRWGKFFGLYLIWYSIGRYFIEGMRLDPSDIYFGLRTNQWAALLTILAGIALIIIQGRNHPGIEISPYRPGYVPPAPEVKKPKKGKASESEEASLDEEIEEIENSEEIELVGSKTGKTVK